MRGHRYENLFAIGVPIIPGTGGEVGNGGHCIVTTFIGHLFMLGNEVFPPDDIIFLLQNYQ